MLELDCEIHNMHGMRTRYLLSSILFIFPILFQSRNARESQLTGSHRELM
jgi:hypothetical protein